MSLERIMRQRRQDPRRGVALVLALLVSTLLTIIVIEFVYSTAVDLRQAKRYKDDAQITIAVDAGLMFAEALLLDDKVNGEEKEIDTLDDVWAAADIPSSIGQVSIDVTITDEASKLDLTNLVYPNEIWAEEWKQAFIRLCEDVREGEAGENYEDIAEELIDYMTREKQFDLESEDDVFAGGALLSVDDLLEVEGVTQEFLFGTPDEDDPKSARTEGLWPYLTLYSNGRINLNTTGEKIIRSLHEEMTTELATDIIGRRSETAEEDEESKEYYRQKNELRQVEGMDDPITDGEETVSLYDLIKQKLTCKTNYFLVEVEVHLGQDLSRHFRAYYKRFNQETFRLLLEEVSPERTPLPTVGVDVDDVGLPFPR